MSCSALNFHENDVHLNALRLPERSSRRNAVVRALARLSSITVFVNQRNLMGNLMKYYLKTLILILIITLSTSAFANLNFSVADINGHINRCYKQTLLVVDKRTESKASTVSCSALINSRMLPNKQQANMLTNRAVVYFYTGQTEKAFVDFKRALALNPQLLEAHIAIAQIFYSKGEFNEALTHYEKAISIDGNNALLKRNRDVVVSRIVGKQHSKLAMNTDTDKSIH